MRTRTNATVACLTALIVAAGATLAAAADPATPADPATLAVQAAYDLGGPRAMDTQYFVMHTTFTDHADNGTRTVTRSFVLKLKYEPAPSGEGGTCTCASLTYSIDGADPIGIPALAGWVYPYRPTAAMTDEHGQTLGISHERFAGLTNEHGEVLPPQLAYVLYNNFIDFHAMLDIFGRPQGDGGGIEDLALIGDVIVHAAANTEPAINLGDQIAPGSYFRNGEVTLELKGISAVDGATCALVGYDSGESHFKMIIKPMPNMQVDTEGSSHYWGDLYFDLATNWIRRVELNEMVVTQVMMGGQEVQHAAVDRTTTIRAVSQEEFQAD